MTGLRVTQLSLQGLGVMDWTLALFSFSLLAPLASATYNLLLRPLRHISGPLLALVLWLKTRGLDRLLGLLTPPAAQQYYQFVQDSVTDRLELQSQQMKKPEEERRQDLFHFLCKAWDPASDKYVYDEAALRAEANLLIIAGSDPTCIRSRPAPATAWGRTRPWRKS
ncbi:uncharacterized protein PG998_008365 [Apiospora kogelbergensis]|uniref:uncharacterized protein n=1 Tax=Apiospora kogelbergensis TaxID=1337665 RepID=UPI00312DC514